MADFEDKTKPHWGIIVDKDGMPTGGVHSPLEHCPDDRSTDSKDGPVMVNNNAFRSGWDSTFGKKELPN